MLVPIYWFNDTHVDQTLLRNTLSDVIATVKPQEGISFEIEIPEGKQLFIKQWYYNHVLFSVSVMFTK